MICMMHPSGHCSWGEWTRLTRSYRPDMVPVLINSDENNVKQKKEKRKVRPRVVIVDGEEERKVELSPVARRKRRPSQVRQGGWDCVSQIWFTRRRRHLPAAVNSPRTVGKWKRSDTRENQGAIREKKERK